VSWKERYQHVESILGILHMQPLSATNILKNHHGPANKAAPEALWTHNQILKRKNLNLEKSQLFKPTLELIDHSNIARILDCFEVAPNQNLLMSGSLRKLCTNGIRHAQS
jgi:hypothetical protein